MISNLLILNLLTVMLFSNTEVVWDGQDIQHVQEIKHLLHVKVLSKITTLTFWHLSFTIKF
jgi:hypothetical protein